MNEAGYVVCATCGDYAVDFNAVMLDCSTCENSYHHTCVGMGFGELGRRTAATNAMRKSKGKNGGADGDVTGTLYDWKCPDCQQHLRVPEPDKDKEEVLVIEDTDDEDDGERTTYIDLSYNVDIHRVAPSQRALLPTTTTVRRPAVHMQNVAGLLNRSTVGASTSTGRASNSNSNISASTSASTSKPVPASPATSTSPQSHNATTTTATRNVQTPLSPPPSRSPSRTGPPTNGTAPVPFVDFTAMATSSKKRRRSLEAGEGGLEDERAKKKSRIAGPATLSRTPVEPIDLTLSDDEVLVTPAAPSTSSRPAAASVSLRNDAASVSSAGSRSRTRHGPGSVSSCTTDLATEDEPVPTRNLMRASLAGRTPRVPLASPSGPRPPSTVPSKRRLSPSPSNSHSHSTSVKRAVVQKPAEREEQEDDGEDDEEHAFFRSRRTSGVCGGGGLTRTRSDAEVLPLPASTSTATPRSTAPTRTQSDGALALGSGSQLSKNASAPIPLEKTSIGEADEPPSRHPAPAPASNHPPTSSSSRGPPASSSSRIGAIEAKATHAQAVTVQDVDADVDVDNLPDYVSDEERESTALPAASTASRVPPTSASAPAPATDLSSSRATLPASRPTSTTTTFRKPALPAPRPAAPEPSNNDIPVPIHSSTSTSQPLFLPDSPSPSPERRESQSQRLMSLPPISFLDEEEADVEDEPGTGVGAGKGVDGDGDMDELEDEDELELESGVGVGAGVVRKKKKRADGEGSTAGKEKARPATDDAVLNTTERRKESTTRRHEQQGRSYAQQVVDERLEDVSEAGLASLFDRAGEGGSSTSGSKKKKKKKKHREREADAGTRLDPLSVPALGLAASLDKMKHADAESSTSGSVKEKKKKHREREVDAASLARPALGLSGSTTFAAAGVDGGAGESSTSSSVKDTKKKHRDRDRDAAQRVVDPLVRPTLGLSASASLEKTKRAVLGADADAQGDESSTSGSAKDKKKKKHCDRDGDAAQGPVDALAVLFPGLSASPQKKTKHAAMRADGGEGESSTASSVKEKKKKHRAGDAGAVDALAVSAPYLSTSLEKTKNKHRHLDTDIGEGESSTSSSVKKKKKKHRERERDAAQGVVDAPAVKTPTFKEPATPDRRVGDLTVSWGRLQELASFSPSSAKKTTTARDDVDGDSFPSTVREEASSSRQLGRKTARPPPSPTLDKRATVSSSSTHRPLTAMSAAKRPLPPARFPPAAGVPSSTAPASSSSTAARPSASASRPDAEQRKEKQPMQTQRARKTVLRREDRDDASAPAVPERTKAAAAPDAPGTGKGKSTLDKYSARAVASSSSTVLPPSTSTSTLPPSSRASVAVLDPSSSRPSAPSSSRSKHRERPSVADPSLHFEAPVVPRRKAIAGVDYPLPEPAKPNKKATARKVPRTALVSDEETPMEVDVDARVHTSRKGKEKEQAITVDDDLRQPQQNLTGKEKARPEGSKSPIPFDRPKPPPIPRLRSASIWSSSTPTPAPSPYTTSSPSLDAVTAFLKKRRMANPLPSSSTLPSAPTQGQKMAATKRRLERGEHESDLPVPMSVLANAREMQTLRRLVKRGTVVKNTLKRSVGEVKTDVVRPFDWAKYRVESERKEGVEDCATA